MGERGLTSEELYDLMVEERREKGILTSEELYDLIEEERREKDRMPEDNENTETSLPELLDTGLNATLTGMQPFYGEAKNSIISGVLSPFVNNTDNEKASYGEKFKANYNLLKERDKDLAKKSPTIAMVGEIAGSILSPYNKYIGRIGGAPKSLVGKIAKGGAIGATTGAINSLDKRDVKDWKQNLVDDTISGAKVGATTGAAVELLKKTLHGLGGAANVAKRGVGSLKKGIEDIPVVRKFVTKTANEIEDDVIKFTGSEKSSDAIGQIFRDITDDTNKKLSEKSQQMFSKAKEEMGNTKFLITDKNSNFVKSLKELLKEQNKTGRKYLNNLVGSLDKKMNYEQVRTLQSKLSKDLINGKSELNQFKIGKLAEALDDDIMETLAKNNNSKAYNSLKNARSYYSNEQNNPNSLTNAVKRFLGSDNKIDDSQLGRRVEAAIKSVAGKQTSLEKILSESNEDKVNALKKAIQANITTRVQYNRMSPQQRKLAYGELEKQVEKIFNGGVLNRAEKSLNSAIDAVKKKTDNGKFTGEKLTRDLSNIITRLMLNEKLNKNVNNSVD